MRTPIYYGRCHKEGDGTKVYFVVNKMVPKLNIEEDKENNTSAANATKASNKTTNLPKTGLKMQIRQLKHQVHQSILMIHHYLTRSHPCPFAKKNQTKGCRPAGESLDQGSLFEDTKENLTVNSVSSRAAKDEKAPPPKPKYDDGYEHKHMEHIHVDKNSGTFQEAVKEFYQNEMVKAKAL